MKTWFYLMLLSAPSNPPVWLLWILVLCVLYPFVAVKLGIDWPFEKTPSEKEILRQAQIRTQPKPKPKSKSRPQARPEPKPKPEPQPEPQPEPEPEPQTDPQLIEDVIAGLHNAGFKKKDAKAAVLRVCERGVFEDHQSLIQAALDKSNL